MKKSSLRMILFTAVVVSIGTSIGAYGDSVVQSIYKTIYPGPYAFLQGHYRGHWSWIDGGRSDETYDDLFITDISEDVVTGTGTDFCLGDYQITKGSIDRSGKIIMHYDSADNSVQPSDLGFMRLSIVKTKPNVVLEGDWTGANRDSNAPFKFGKVTLTQTPDDALVSNRACSDATDNGARAESLGDPAQAR